MLRFLQWNMGYFSMNSSSRDLSWIMIFSSERWTVLGQSRSVFLAESVSVVRFSVWAHHCRALHITHLTALNTQPRTCARVRVCVCLCGSLSSVSRWDASRLYMFSGGCVSHPWGGVAHRYDKHYTHIQQIPNHILITLLSWRNHPHTTALILTKHSLQCRYSQAVKECSVWLDETQIHCKTAQNYTSILHYCTTDYQCFWKKCLKASSHRTDKRQQTSLELVGVCFYPTEHAYRYRIIHFLPSPWELVDVCWSVWT